MPLAWAGDIDRPVLLLAFGEAHFDRFMSFVLEYFCYSAKTLQHYFAVCVGIIDEVTPIFLCSAWWER